MPRKRNVIALVAAVVAVIAGCGETGTASQESQSGGDAKPPTQQVQPGVHLKDPTQHDVVVGRVDDLAGLSSKVDARGRLLEPIRLRRGLTALAPAPPGLVPAITADKALAALRSEELYENTLAAVQPRLALGLLDSLDTGGTVTVTPGVYGASPYQGRLVWAVMFHDVVSEYGPSGGGGLHSSPGASAADQKPVRVNFVAFIDALTGTFLFAEEIGLLQDVS